MIKGGCKQCGRCCLDRKQTLKKLGETLECFDTETNKCKYFGTIRMGACLNYPWSRAQILEGCGYYWEAD